MTQAFRCYFIVVGLRHRGRCDAARCGVATSAGHSMCLLYELASGLRNCFIRHTRAPGRRGKTPLPDRRASSAAGALLACGHRRASDSGRASCCHAVPGTVPLSPGRRAATEQRGWSTLVRMGLPPPVRSRRPGRMPPAAADRLAATPVMMTLRSP